MIEHICQAECDCKTPHVVDEMFAFLVDDQGEGIPSFYSPELRGHMPMVGADLGRAESMMEIARYMSNTLGKKIELVRFTNREHVEWIEPQ